MRYPHGLARGTPHEEERDGVEAEARLVGKREQDGTWVGPVIRGRLVRDGEELTPRDQAHQVVRRRREDEPAGGAEAQVRRRRERKESGM
jgi:hypothetical protein